MASDIHGHGLNVKMPSYQYRNFHHKDKTVLWPVYYDVLYL